MKKWILRNQKAEQGFTLLEMLAVIAIIGILSGVVARSIWHHIIESKQEKAGMDIAMIESSVEMYRLYNGKLPADLQSLARINEKTKKRYIKELPLDPWENEYVFIYPSEWGDFEILSLGADGQIGGDGEDKDISNYKRKRD